MIILHTYLATLSTQDMGSEASLSSTSSERPEAAAMALAIVQPTTLEFSGNKERWIICHY